VRDVDLLDLRGLRVVCCNERKYSVAGRAQVLDLPPFQVVKGVAGDVGFAVVSDEGVAEIDNT
jgi:hypothetical protein